MSQTKSSRSARSAGFTGSYQDDYYPLYSATCVTNEDCQTACVQAGGTQTSCASSECIDSTPDYCLPPTYWFDLERLRVEASSIEDAAWLIMVNNPYRDQLIATQFQFELPTSATVSGIEVNISRASDAPEMVADYEVKLVRAGATLGLDRAKTNAWPATAAASAFTYADYGSSSDLWGSTWLPADVNAEGFGVALTPMYLDTAGNARAYVAFIRATIHYSVSCD